MMSRRIFASSAFAPVAAATLALLLAGCGTRGAVDAMSAVAEPSVLESGGGIPQPGSATYRPMRSQQSAQEAAARARIAAQSQPQVTTGPTNTGAFPNLNIRPNAAAEQLTPEESTALLDNLRSTQGRLNAANVAAARSIPNAETLRKIGADHGDATLQAIEAQAAE